MAFRTGSGAGSEVGALIGIPGVAELRAEPLVADKIVVLETYDPDNGTVADQGLFQALLDNVVDNGVTRFNVGGIGTIGPGWQRIDTGPYKVQWGGAVGNGIIDDAPAIRRTLNAAIADMQSVFIPAGKYLCNSGFTLTSGISIVGATHAPAGGIAGGNAPSSILIHNFDGDLFTFNGADSVPNSSGGGLENLRIVQAFGNSSGTPRGVAIKAVALDYVRRPAWCRFYNLIIEETGNDPWTWGFEVDGGVKSYSNTGIGVTSPVIDATITRLAQRFVITSAAAISSVRAQLNINTALVTNVRIETDSAGSPSGVLADPALLHLAYAFNGTTSNRITFIPEAILAAGTYWVVFVRTSGSGEFNGSNTGTSDQVKTFSAAVWSVPAGGPDNITGQVSGIFGGIQDFFIGEVGLHCSPVHGLGGSLRLNGCAGLRMFNSHFSLAPGGLAVIGDTDASNSVQFENCSFSDGVDMQFGADFTIIGGIYGDISTSVDTVGTVLILPGRLAGTFTNGSGAATGLFNYNSTVTSSLSGSFRASKSIALPNTLGYFGADKAGTFQSLIATDNSGTNGLLRINAGGAFDEVRFGGVGVPTQVGITNGPLKFYTVARVDADGIDLAVGTVDATGVTIGKTGLGVVIHGTPQFDNATFATWLKNGGGSIVVIGLDTNNFIRIGSGADALVAIGAPATATSATGGDLLFAKDKAIRFANNAGTGTVVALDKDTSDFVRTGFDLITAGFKGYAAGALMLQASTTGVKLWRNGAAQVAFECNATGLAFYGGAPVAQPTVTGALSAVLDANAKNVLTSIIAALKVTTGVDLVIDGTT